jgi:AcrR family transcriptional regulator
VPTIALEPVAVDARPSEPGRRERKKQATRDALVAAALELFAADGVDATSVEQIAERVDVSARTFHRYFPSKDDVLFADSAARSQRLLQTLHARPAGEDVLASLQAGLTELVRNLAADPEREKLRLRVVEGNDRLRARSLRASDELAEVIAGYVTGRLPRGVAPAMPQLLAAWSIGALRVVHKSWLADPRLDPLEQLAGAYAALADVRAATS